MTNPSDSNYPKNDTVSQSGPGKGCSTWNTPPRRRRDRVDRFPSLRRLGLAAGIDRDRLTEALARAARILDEAEAGRE